MHKCLLYVQKYNTNECARHVLLLVAIAERFRWSAYDFIWERIDWETITILVGEMASSSSEPGIAKEAVLLPSSKLPDDTPVVSGYDWNQGIDYNRLFESYLTSGFQATNFGLAVNEINKMVCTNNRICK